MAVLFYAVRLESGEMFPKRLETPEEAIALAEQVGAVAVSVHYITPCAWQGCYPLNKLRGSHTCCLRCYAQYVIPEIAKMRESLAGVA